MRVYWARFTTGASTMRPSTDTAPRPRSAASLAAATTFLAFSISPSVGVKTSWMMGIWLGWITLLPS